MGFSEWMGILSLVIATGAAVFSYQQAYIAKKTLEAVQEQAEVARKSLEWRIKRGEEEALLKKKADVHLKSDLYHDSEYRCFRILVENEGLCEAQDVKIEIVEWQGELPQKANYELKLLSPEQIVTFYSSDDIPFPVTLRASWLDECAPERQSKIFVLYRTWS